MSEIKLQQKAAYTLGIDVGSTTVKTVILDADHHVLHSTYQRHFSKVKEAVSEQLQAIIKEHPATLFSVHMTGSAGLGLATAAKIPFVQEVHAAFLAVKERYPEADAVIELGGEDAKIIFLTGGVEQRMNGSCAGGTGAFIDQMATLLDVTVDELDQMALQADRTYPHRCTLRRFCKVGHSAAAESGSKTGKCRCQHLSGGGRPDRFRSGSGAENSRARALLGRSTLFPAGAAECLHADAAPRCRTRNFPRRWQNICCLWLCPCCGEQCG